MKVLVLLGGDSPEREVSLKSGKAVYDACVQAGFETTTYDPKDGFEGLRTAVQDVDVVLPILHGVNGEDGVIQHQLEDLGVPYLGADSTVSAICFDKDKTHEVLGAVGVRMPKYALVSEKDVKTHPLFTKPYVLKPARGGSSVDTQIARSATEAELAQSEKLLQKYDVMIAEELVKGQEITVPILGEEALSVIAIIPPENGEFDYENKYNGSTKEIVPVSTDMISEQIQMRAKELALKVHREMAVRHLSRTDMFVTKDGELIVLEINTIPGMNDQSLMPKAALVAGMDMSAFATRLVELVGGKK